MFPMLGRSYLFVALSGVLVHIAIIYWDPGEYENENTLTLSSDATSAIRRAKTDICKKELTEYAIQLAEQNHLPPDKLIRRCPRDQETIEFNKIGCINEADAANQTITIESFSNLTDCLETCFSYGHAYGGFHETNELSRCLCGDTNRIDLYDCDTTNSVEWFELNRGVYRPTATKCRVPKVSDGAQQPVRLAFILTLKGRSSLQVRRLLSNIYSANHTYYLHVDNFENYLFEQLLPLESKYSNIVVARNRSATVWGGTQLLTAIINAFKELSGYSWNYVINLSESDLPIKPLHELESYLQGEDCIFLRSHNLRGYNFIKKQGLDRSFYQCERRVWRLGKRRLPTGLIYSGGSDWFALPRSFSDYILASSEDSNENLVRPLLELFNHTLLPAESFFHTLALNSEFCDKFVDNNLRVNNWKRKQGGCKCQQRTVVDWCGCSPHVYRLDDLERLKNLSLWEDLFFTRKFDPTISQGVINEVERKLLNRNQTEPPAPAFWLNVYSSGDSSSSHSDTTIFKQMAALAYGQLGLTPLEQLISVDHYFENDRFLGIVMEICDPHARACRQMLVSAKIEEPPTSSCQNLNQFKLIRIEFGHGFDPSEKLFRNHNPLNTRSDLIVNHEWLVVDDPREAISELALKFQWYNPAGLVFAQDIKLKPPAKRSHRLTFAHRLARKEPLDAGLWTLKISHRDEDCIERKFLVFSADDEPTIEQEDFNQIYQVRDECVAEADVSDTTSCLHPRWSLIQKRKLEQDLL